MNYKLKYFIINFIIMFTMGYIILSTITNLIWFIKFGISFLMSSFASGLLTYLVSKRIKEEGVAKK